MAFIPVYILILAMLIVVDYVAGLLIENAREKRRKWIFITSIVVNIAMLAIFKYFMFFNSNLTAFLHIFGQHNPIPLIKFILPLGLSFHTFQAMSYLIEVYRGDQKAERHFGIYSLYVMFYPQLVAGPIERPQNLLPQFKQEHHFDAGNLKSGLLQMAVGLFKKVVIADRLAIAVDYGFGDYTNQSGLSLTIAALLYSFQIYCDFSGYSDIAIGAARCMGFKLMTNFNTPYLARSVSEYWRRWHISLSTWFKDYVYIPLGGSRVTIPRFYLNLMIVFLLSGLWHGASWTFVVWGGLNGIIVIIEHSLGKLKHKMRLPQVHSRVKEILSITIAFLLVSLVRVFFRAPEIGQAGEILKRIFTMSFNDVINLSLNSNELYFSLFLIVVLVLFETRWPKITEMKTTKLGYYLLMAGILFSCYLFGVFNYRQFIYFQF
ncbi:MBOAT family O-acyltransferase [Mucilaginibacter hurinus]|nr:MBOAT family O-acyltransferase [Mucilaginibacter hurinus]